MKDVSWLQMIVTIICSVLASSGFWAYIQKKNEKTDNKTKLLLGLAHDRIMSLGMKHIARGSITKDEFENLHDYLYVPYSSIGNGSAKRIMEEVKKLPIKSTTEDR